MSLNRIVNLSKRWVWLLLVIAYAVPVLYPLNLPVPVTEYPRSAYNAVDALPAGSVLALDVSIGMNSVPELMATTVVIIKHSFMKNLKLVTWSIDEPQGPVLTEMAIREANPEKYGKKYGVDYVILPYLAGGEAAEVSMMNDIPATTSRDYYGTSITQLPMMSTIKSSKDIKLIVAIAATQADDRVRQYGIAGGQKFIFVTYLANTPGAIPYVSSGNLISVLGGAIGGAQYETLLKQPGRGIAVTDSLNSLIILVIGLVAVSNIVHLFQRSKGVKEQ